MIKFEGRLRRITIIWCVVIGVFIAIAELIVLVHDRKHPAGADGNSDSDSGFADPKPQTVADIPGLENLPARALVLRPVKFVDPLLCMNACTGLVPPGWTYGTSPETQRGCPLPTFGLFMTDRKGETVLRIFPELNLISGFRERQEALEPGIDLSEAWKDGTEMPAGGDMIATLPETILDYIQHIVIPRYCKDINAATDVAVVSQTDLPDLAKAAVTDQRPNCQSGRVRLTYTSKDGPQEAEFVCTFRAMAPDASNCTLWTADVSMCSAPQGKLDGVMPTLGAIRASIVYLPDWVSTHGLLAAYDANLIAKYGQQTLDAMWANTDQNMILRHQLDTQATVQQQQNIQDAVNQASQARDKNAEQVVEFVSGTAMFSDPNSGRKIVLPGSYQYQYEDNHGDIIQSNTAAPDLPLDANTSWEQMQAAH